MTSSFPCGVMTVTTPSPERAPKPTLVRMSAPARKLRLALFANSAWCVDDGLCSR
ncbi:hypothetical protein SXIM_40500 [Streptomyces xiamenensis]|uniref:Uncharacterized protein n=1 Tax=Streptomyces xiamenensis TaxID=408015 RepID=A0A0F7FYY2_9ACTN|nr:hypothetical protein SXIM_40500 [Streptomyces xiamenensis]